MSAGEILAYVPADIYVAIKEEDPKPLFRAYVVGHEGVSEGRVVGAGAMVKQWLASAIKGLYDKLEIGIKLFHGHAATNEHAGRPSIGMIVGKALKDIGDRLTAVVIAYIKPEFRHLPLDVASIEATVRLDEGGQLTDMDVGEITGIALGNSAVNTPGFAGATLLAQVQAFADQRDQRKALGGGAMPTVSELIEAIRADKMKPSDLFGVEALSEDTVVKGIVADRTRGIVKEREERIDDLGKKFDARKKEVEDKLTAAQQQLLERDLEISKGRIPELLAKAAKERKLTDKQVKFIEKHMKRFTPSAPDKLEADLAKHLDAELDVLKDSAEVLGVVTADAGKSGEQQAGDTGTGPDTTARQTPGGIASKYTDPKTNPFIRPV